MYLNITAFWLSLSFHLPHSIILGFFFCLLKLFYQTGQWQSYWQPEEWNAVKNVGWFSMKFLSWNIILVSRGWPIGYWLMSWVFGPSCLETPGITDDSKPSKSQQLSNWNLKMSAQLSCADKKRTLVLLLMFAIMFCMPECHSYVKQFARNFQMPLLIGKRYVCTVCAQHTIS